MDIRTIHVLSLGVGAYRDQKMSLKYPAKDAVDLAKGIASLAHPIRRYKPILPDGAAPDEIVIPGIEVKTHVLTDREVNRESIRRLRSALADVRIDDLVIVFMAGHGVLDRNEDGSTYYFAPWDMDFALPAAKGISYDIIEELLDRLPARRKLLLVDTCHAGDVDDTIIVRNGDKADLAKGVVQGSRGLAGAVRGNRVLSHSALLLLDELFADVERGSGALVMAASRGDGFAFETEQLQNGLFTHAVLEALGPRRPSNVFKSDLDRDGNGALSISEIAGYVRQRVSRMTAGRQTPVVRRGPLSHDFSFER